MKFNNAAWISAPEDAQTCPLFKKQICLRGTVKKAELRATAMGMYRFFIDGKDVTDALFMPGWTDYVKRVQVQTYDVTRFFACCKEYAELSLLLGNGWASAEIFVGVVHPYIPRAAAIAELTLTYADGKRSVSVRIKVGKPGPTAAFIPSFTWAKRRMRRSNRSASDTHRKPM